jgi:hypothetical protein
MSDARPVIDDAAIRGIVRELLRELKPAILGRRSDAGGKAHPVAEQPRTGAPVPASSEEVALDTDAQLSAFVLRLIQLAEDATMRGAIRAGRVRFRLRRSAATQPGKPQPRERLRPTPRIVTERDVMAAARQQGRIVLDKGMVMTPLARDKARQLGIAIERTGR